MRCCSTTAKALASNGAAASPAPTPAPPTSKPGPSFYRRPLPESCVALSSEEGQKRFVSALAAGGSKSFFPLIEQFATQSEPAFCGISTLVIVLNALAVDPRRSWKGPWRWYEEGMLNCCVDMEEIKQTGITLGEFRCLATCQGLSATMVRADDDEDALVGLMRFRRAVQQACVKSQQNGTNDGNHPVEVLVASYSRRVLGQSGSGHFSPLAAYDEESDSVLVLDTARFKYGVHWVSMPLLFDAMTPVDPDTGRSRGYVLLSHHDHGNEEVGSPLLPSLLFRSQRKQNSIRRDYKDFLATHSGKVNFDQVASFWTKDIPNLIWKMMEPQFTPLAGEESDFIAQVRALMNRIMRNIPHQELTKECCQCRVNFARTLDLSVQEAILVVFLASLDEDKRKEIVMTPDSTGFSQSGDSEPHATPAQTQLLAEAELVRRAIDMSDE